MPIVLEVVDVEEFERWRMRQFADDGSDDAVDESAAGQDRDLAGRPI